MNLGSDNYCAPLFAGNDLLSQFFCSNYNSSSSALTSNQLASGSILSFSIMPTPIVTVDSNINDHSKLANGKASLQVNKCRLSTGLLEDVVKQACYKHSPFIHPFDLNHNQETEFTEANESDDDLLINPGYDHVSNSHSLIDNCDIDAVCNRLSSKYADYDEKQASCVKHAFLQLPPLISVDTIADEGRMQSTHIKPDYHSITGPIHHSKPQYNSEFSRSWLSDLPHTDNVDSYSPAQYLGILEQSTSAFYGCTELYDGPVHDASPLYSSADIADIRIAHASDVADMYLNGADDDNTPATSISVPASHINVSVTHESRELSDHGKTEVCYLPHNVSHLYAVLRPDHVADKCIPDQSVATADVRGRTRTTTRLPVGLLQASRSFNIDQVEQVPELLSSSLNWLQYRDLAPQRDPDACSHGDSLGSLSNIQNNLHECARCSYAKEESIKLCKMTAFLHKKHQGIDDYCIDLNSSPDQQIVGPNCGSSTEQLQLLFDQKTLHHASEKAPISPTCKLFRSSFAERLASPHPSTLSEEPLELRTSSDRICAQYSALLRNQIARAETYNKHDGRTGGLCKENLHLSGEYSDHIMCVHSLFRNRAAGSAIPRIEDAGVQALTSSSLIISNIPSSHSSQKSLAATRSGYHKRTASAVLDDAVDAYTNWSRISSSPQTKRQRTSSVFNAPTGGSTDDLRSDCQLASDVLAGNHVTLRSNNICELQPSAYTCMKTEAGNIEIDVESKIKLYKQKLANQASEAPLDRFAASMAEVPTSNDCTTSQISSSAVSPSTSPTATIRVPFKSAPFCPNHMVLLQSDAHVMEIAIDDEINRRGTGTVSKMLMKEVRPSTETVPILTAKSSDEFGERGILGCCCCSGEGVPGALASTGTHAGAKIQNHGSSILLNGRRCAAILS